MSELPQDRCDAGYRVVVHGPKATARSMLDPTERPLLGDAFPALVGGMPIGGAGHVRGDGQFLDGGPLLSAGSLLSGGGWFLGGGRPLLGGGSAGLGVRDARRVVASAITRVMPELWAVATTANRSKQSIEQRPHDHPTRQRPGPCNFPARGRICGSRPRIGWG